MSEDHTQKLMQDALDGMLSPEGQAELQAILSQDPEQAQAFDAQRRVDDLLRYPTHERAPERLAITIMARIAQTMQARQQQHSHLQAAQMQVAIQLVTVVSLPLLVGAGYMLLNNRSDKKALERVLTQVSLLLILVTDVIDTMIEEAAALYDEDPQMALVALSLIPSALLVIVKEIMGIDDESTDAPA